MVDFIAAAISEAKIEIVITEKSDNLYRCALTSVYGKMKREISMKPGYSAPSLGNILYHYAVLSQQIDRCDDILDWAKERECNLNEASTIVNFNQLLEDQKDLRILLSEPIYQKLLTGLEISQAIENAYPR